MRETRQSGSEGGEGDLPDPYTRGASATACVNLYGAWYKTGDTA